MKQFFAYAALLLLLSCKGDDKNSEQEENWVLKNKKVFTDKLNIYGYPDTTYTKLINYDNLNVKDSSEMFAVSKYDDQRRLVSKLFFIKDESGSPVLESQSDYAYTGKYLSSMTDRTSGILTKQESYTYDTSGKLLKSEIIRLKNFDEIFKREKDKTLAKEVLLKQGYDTLHISYNYDSGNKNVGANMVDNRGNLIRKDINVYAGTTPLSSYNLGPKGDTLQRISYAQQGDKLTSQADNENFIIVTAMQAGYLTGKLTFDKKKNEKLRQEWRYEDGRLREEKFYVNEIRTQKK